MNDVMNTLSGGTALIVYPLLFFLVILIVVLWILMPFAVFGLKPRIDDAVKELRQISAELALLSKHLREKTANKPATHHVAEPEDKSQG